MPKQRTALVVVVLVLLAAGGVAAGLYLDSPGQEQAQSPEVVQVVAAENFWGSLASQLGGTHAHVVSIVSDPNADPHEYESTAADARAISDASLVIVNGAGYDTWALSIISASHNLTQRVLNVQETLGLPVGANPHFWYSPYYVNDTVRAMYGDLVSIDPASAPYFRQQYAALNASLGAYNARIHEIAAQFAGTKVAATEDVFTYLANATRLDLVSPVPFMQAVAQGGEPPAASVVQFQQLLENKSVSILVYNAQTVTPLTESMKALATQNGIPDVAITETVQPPSATFQAWMNAELLQIQSALGQ